MSTIPGGPLRIDDLEPYIRFTGAVLFNSLLTAATCVVGIFAGQAINTFIGHSVFGYIFILIVFAFPISALYPLLYGIAITLIMNRIPKPGRFRVFTFIGLLLMGYLIAEIGMMIACKSGGCTMP